MSDTVTACVALTREDVARFSDVELARIIRYPGEYHREVVARLAADLRDARTERDQWVVAAIKYLEASLEE